MKKTIKHVLSVCLVLLSFVLIFTSCGQKDIKLPDSEGLAYSVNEDGISCTITGIGTCTDTKIGIPETIDGYTVTGIGDCAFEGCTSLTSITIPDSVTNFAGGAFADCTALTSITIPDGVTSIGWSTFRGCTSLTSITIPDSVTSIGKVAFEGCTSLTSITIPDGVTSIGDYAFDGCTSLASIDIPDSVTSIGCSAFYGCTSLTSVTIPDSVTSVEMSAFADCTSIKSVYITDIEKWFSICFDLPGSNPMFYGADLYLNGKLVTDLVIPDTVTSIGPYTFYGCPSLTSITVEDGNPVYHSNGNCLIETGSKTLIAGCSTSVIPDDGSVTSIRDHAFAYCTALTSITLPDCVTSIGHYAFAGCKSLTSITIPDGVTSISYSAFSGCTALTSITIPDGVTSIDSLAFSGCTALTSITIPDGVTSIGGSAFEDCKSLTSIHYSGTIEQWNAIDKVPDWDYNTGDCVVHCTDGDISE